MEEDFPRGRVKREEPNAKEKSIVEKKRKDILFGHRGRVESSKKSKPNQKKDAAVSRSLLPIGGGGCNVKSGWIEPLSFTKLQPGMRLLACCREVHPDVAIFSLPNLWTGFMDRTDTENDPALDLCLVENQMVSVVVVEATVVDEGAATQRRRRRIQVTCVPEKVNPTVMDVPNLIVRGRIKSLEDHGILVDLGVGRKGFLPFNRIEGSYETSGKKGSEEHHHVFHEHRILDFLVHGPPTANVIPLRLPQSLANIALPPGYKPSLADLQPGTLLSTVTLERCMKNGLAVLLCGNSYRGSIEIVHTGAHWMPTERGFPDRAWRSFFERHASIHAARIIAVDPRTKIIRLSLLPHLLQLEPAVSDLLPQKGEIVEECTVLRVDPGIGALLAYPGSYGGVDSAPMEIDGEQEEEDANVMLPIRTKDKDYHVARQVRTVYVHISKARDGGGVDGKGKMKKNVFSKQFAPSTTHTVRVLSTNHRIEGMASGATAPRIVDAHIMQYSDMVPGKRFDAVPILQQLPGGSLVVSFGMGVKGLVPKDHLFDTSTSTSSTFRQKVKNVKFAVGQTIDVRVLTIEKTRCVVTAKPSLVQAPEKRIVTSFATATVDQVIVGCVSKITDDGLYVSLFGGVFGRLPAKQLASELGVENHKESYKLGDVLTCKVFSIRTKHIPKNKQGKSKKKRYHDDDDAVMEDAAYDETTTHYDIYLSPWVEGSTSKTGDETEGQRNLEKLRSSKTKVTLQPGSVIPLKAMRVVQLCPHQVKHGGEGGKQTMIIPGYAVVAIKSKYLVRSSADEALLPSNMECKLPYDHLLDEYETPHLQDLKLLDQIAKERLTMGKKINQKGLVLTDPQKLSSDYACATGAMATISLRPQLIETAELQQQNEDNEMELSTTVPRLPNPSTHFFAGAVVRGYVARIDQRHGAFVRFLGDITGLVPTTKGGLLVSLYKTMDVKVLAVDSTVQPPKILLGLLREHQPPRQRKKAATGPTMVEDVETKTIPEDIPYGVGDIIPEVEVEKVGFRRAQLQTMAMASTSHILSLHCTKAKQVETMKKPKGGNTKQEITSCHPFFGVKEGDRLANLKVIEVTYRNGVWFVEVEQMDEDDNASPTSDSQVLGVVLKVTKMKGILLALDSATQCFIPLLEVSEDLDVLHNLQVHFPVGCRVACFQTDKSTNRNAGNDEIDDGMIRSHSYSLIAKPNQLPKPKRGDLAIGRIDRSLNPKDLNTLWLRIRGDLKAKCCITELDDMDDWVDHPLTDGKSETPRKSKYAHGNIVQCRVINSPGRRNLAVEVSLRPTRLEGDMDEDEPPEVGATAPAYVMNTEKSGCFLRMSRQVEGRAILKELCDAYLPNPSASFPPGRLVAAMIKAIREKKTRSNTTFEVDVDMRESVLNGESGKRVSFEDIELGARFSGCVTRIEDYGVFVQLLNSEVTGLVHKSECSDTAFVKNPRELYHPGDLVKVIVLRKLPEKHQIGLSMKSSHFEVDHGDSSSESDDDVEVQEAMDVDSEDEDFVKKLAQRVDSSDDEGSGSSSKSNDDSESDSESSSSVDSERLDNSAKDNVLDTNVGFDWSGASIGKPTKLVVDDDESESSESEDDSKENKSSKRSRNKQAERRKEEKEIARREAALADGTADENPETVADFERLLASEPNSSELWMRFMAFHLSLADINAAREVANRAFNRIEFRLEKEKLNVWCALLTLELKFGDEKSLQEALNRASQNNNPKQIHLRMCEMMETEAATSQSPTMLQKADQLHSQGCKKFRDKKKVWIAYMEFLLKHNRQEESLALSKRAMQSLKPHKHVETMSKFAQLMFQYSSAEKARTLFDGLLRTNRKRLDLLFVYVDKEVKHGEVAMARSLFERVTNLNDDTLEMKFTDKQMKRLFKKWFSFEEEHGTEQTEDRVKEAAQRFIKETS